MSGNEQVERRAAEAVSDLVDRLVALAKAELGPGTQVERSEDGVAISGPGLALRRLADVRLRDLIGVAAHGEGQGGSGER